MHLICRIYYFCFHGNHSHNVTLKVYFGVSLVISYVENSKYILEKRTYFVKKCRCILFAKKNKSMGEKHMYCPIKF